MTINRPPKVELCKFERAIVPDFLSWVYKHAHAYGGLDMADADVLRRMKFGTFLDAEGRFFDTVHFPQTLAKYPLRGAGIYLVEGKVVLEYGCPSIEVIRCAKMPLKPDPRSE